MITFAFWIAVAFDLHCLLSNTTPCQESYQCSGQATHWAYFYLTRWISAPVYSALMCWCARSCSYANRTVGETSLVPNRPPVTALISDLSSVVTVSVLSCLFRFTTLSICSPSKSLFSFLDPHAVHPSYKLWLIIWQCESFFLHLVIFRTRAEDKSNGPCNDSNRCAINSFVFPYLRG